MKEKTHRKPVEITGSVYLINVERRELKLRTDDGFRVPVTFAGEQENRVIAALQMRKQANLKVSGLGEFRPDGVLKRVVSVENFGFALIGREIPHGVLTIGERFDALTADIPEEVWAQIPTDLSERHNYYAYGVDLSE